MTFQRGYDVVSGRKNVASDVVSDVTSNVTCLSPVQLSERQCKICELIKEDAFISGGRMSVVLSVALRTIRRDLAAMQKMGVLLREGNTSAGRWVLLM